MVFNRITDTKRYDYIKDTNKIICQGKGTEKTNIFLLLKQVVKECLKSLWIRFAPYVAVVLNGGSLYGVKTLLDSGPLNSLIL